MTLTVRRDPDAAAALAHVAGTRTLPQRLLSTQHKRGGEALKQWEKKRQVVGQHPAMTELGAMAGVVAQPSPKVYSREQSARSGGTGVGAPTS